MRNLAWTIGAELLKLLELEMASRGSENEPNEAVGRSPEIQYLIDDLLKAREEMAQLQNEHAHLLECGRTTRNELKTAIKEYFDLRQRRDELRREIEQIEVTDVDLEAVRAENKYLRKHLEVLARQLEDLKNGVTFEEWAQLNWELILPPRETPLRELKENYNLKVQVSDLRTQIRQILEGKPAEDTGRTVHSKNNRANVLRRIEDIKLQLQKGDKISCDSNMLQTYLENLQQEIA